MSSSSPIYDEERQWDGHAPLLRQNSASSEEPDDRQASETEQNVSSKGLHRRLYLSHFLSTWNSRAFEFGAVLYLATIFPSTLLPLSIYAFTRGLSAIVFAPSVGLYIDGGDRMQVVRVSIVGQRAVVAISCAVLYLLSKRNNDLREHAKYGLLALLALLACVEKLCSIMNLVSVEKDWVVVVAGGDQAVLTNLNAQMRRIDLVCKLFGPLFIALIDGYSTNVAILVNLGMNVASVIVEYFAIAQVYNRVPALQEPKTVQRQVLDADDGPHQLGSQVKNVCRRTAADFNLYLKHRAFLPSSAGALLYLTVLSFAGQMVTYLLATGYTSLQIGISRTVSVVFEVLATWVAPWLIGHIGPIRAGLWMSSSQLIMLVAGTAVFWTFQGQPLISASGLVVGTILSRLGLRGFDLCAQIIVQNEVEATSRGAFSSVEAGWQSGFELLSYASTMIFSRPDQFKWPALISVVAVSMATSIYSFYVYTERKHLLHLSWPFDWQRKASGRGQLISRSSDNFRAPDDIQRESYALLNIS